MIDHYAYVDEQNTTTMLSVLEGRGILITTMPLGGERTVMGFCYSTESGCQRFYEITGVELTVEEVEAGT